MTLERTSNETIAAKMWMPTRRRRVPRYSAARGEARADDQVGPALEDRLEHLADLARIVLSVAVDLDRELEAVLERVLVARLHGAADADVEGQIQKTGAGACRNGSGLVAGGVVHDHDVQLGLGRADLFDHSLDAGLLVVGRDDRERPELPLSSDRGRLLQGLGRGRHLSG